MNPLELRGVSWDTLLYSSSKKLIQWVLDFFFLSPLLSLLRDKMLVRQSDTGINGRKNFCPLSSLILVKGEQLFQSARKHPPRPPTIAVRQEPKKQNAFGAQWGHSAAFCGRMGIKYFPEQDGVGGFRWWDGLTWPLSQPCPCQSVLLLLVFVTLKIFVHLF